MFFRNIHDMRLNNFIRRNRDLSSLSPLFRNREVLQYINNIKGEYKNIE